MKKKLLFICNLGQQRSPTAKKLFEDRFETEYAGIYTTPVTVLENLFEWADIVFVMEDHQRKFLVERFPKLSEKKKMFCLEIDDTYIQMDQELVNILEKKVKEKLEEK